MRTHVKAMNLCRAVCLPAGEHMQRGVWGRDVSSLNPGDTSLPGLGHTSPVTHTHTPSHLLTGELCRPQATSEPSTRIVIAALLLHSNEPTSTQSKSSDDTDVGRLIFTLDSPSSPLDCCVYLLTQLVSGRRQTDNERVEGWSLRATTLAPIV